jgi:NADH-quinone oxidoreductase subunit H
MVEILKRLFEIVKCPETVPLEAKKLILDFVSWAAASLGVPLPEWVLTAISSVIIIGTVMAIFLTMFALTSVFERKILARMQNRYGPNRVGPCGLLQFAADGIKMITKEDIVPRSADQIVHFLAPIVMVVPAFLVTAILPYGRNMAPIDIQGGILFFFAAGAGTEVAVFMAGWASNNKFSVLGAMRAIAQMISYESPLVISSIAVVMLTGSLSPVTIVEAQGGYWGFGLLPHWFVLTPWGFAGAILFYMGAMAESNRSPFDMPEGESELVAGHLTEYSGFKYAIFFMAEYVGMFAISGLFVTLFLGGWQAPMSFLAFIPSWCWFFAKLAAVVFSMIWIRATLPRFRIDQLMQFAWKFMLPMSLATLVSAALWHYSFASPEPLPSWGRCLLGISSLLAVLLPYLALGSLYNKNFVTGERRYLFAE